MTTTAEAPSSRTRDTRAALKCAVEAMTTRRRAEVEVLQAALVWAHAHTVAHPDDAAGWRSDTVHRPGTAGALFGDRPSRSPVPARRWLRSSRRPSSPPPWISRTRPPWRCSVTS